MKYPPSFLPVRSRAINFLLVCAALVCTSHLLAQGGAGGDTPTGVAGGFGGSISTGGGSLDPYERNASRSVTDIVVPGAVIPFSYTRIWNSRGGKGNNWSWEIQQWESTELNGTSDPNDLFHGYIVYYPDGRVVKFSKPGTPAHAPEAVPGTYTNATGTFDKFVIDTDGLHGHLYMSDGSVLNFDIAPAVDGTVRSIVDPHGRAVTYTYDSGPPWGTKVTEPGGRWIYMSGATLSGNTNTATVTTSLGQSITTTYTVSTSGYYPAGGAGPDTGIYDPGVETAQGSVTYNDVLDPTTNQPLQANYVYKSVQPPPGPIPNTPQPYPFNRLVWASDPLFDGPLQQIKYLYVDDTNAIWGDPSRSAVFEERSATGADDVGVTVSRVKIPSTATWSSTTGYSPEFFARVETRGDGATRTLSYYNSTLGNGQTLVDHFTDFTNDLSQTERHEYDQTRRFRTPIKITDLRQNVTFQTLESALGNITTETHPDTNYVSWTYSDPTAPYYVASKTDELGRAITYTRDPITHLVTRIDYPGGTFETFAYNSFGQVTDHQLASGAHVYQTFDSRGLRTSSSDSVTNEVTTYTYDSKDRLETVRDARATVLGIPYSVKYEYNGRHQITKMHYPATGGASDPTVTYVYDKWGRCTATTDELGNTRTTTYDDYGRPTSYTESLNAPGWNGTGTVASRTWNWTYERVRNGTTYPANTHTAKEWRTQIEPAFDKDGNRRMTIREYDVNNRLGTEQTGWVVSSGGSATFGADGETHSYTYDLNGNKTSYTDPRNRVTSYAFDSRNRLTTTTEPLNRITTTAYDAASNKTLVTFPDGMTQQWLDYDGFAQPGRFIDERNNTTNLTYQWGPMKKLATVTTHRTKDAGGIEDQLTTFSYDGTGRPTRTLFPDGSNEVTTYQYDRLKTWKVRKGATKTISYDARGRETSHTWSDSVTPGITRTWDDANRVLTLSNTYSTITYSYDQAGQVTSESNNVAGALIAANVTYARYPNGDAAHVTYPNGIMLRRDYTARGQLSATGIDAAGNWVQKFVQYSYLADGKVDHEDYGNAVSTAFGYDGRGFTSSTNTTHSGQTYSNRTYYRDSRDRIFAWAKSNTPANNPLENGRGDRYTYDAEGQLTAASYQALTPNTTPTGALRSESFIYDQLGNRKGWNQLARGWTNFGRDDNGLNQYTFWDPPSAINYDDDVGAPPAGPGQANGVMMQDGYYTCNFNALNQPIGMWTPSAPTGLFFYFGFDPLGRCVKRWTAASDVAPATSSTFLFYEGWNLIQEGANALVADRIYAHGNRIDEIVASQPTGGQWNYHHYDARGHCIMLTDATGAIAEQYDYDAFGKPYFYSGNGTLLSNGSAIGNRFLFTGREYLKDMQCYDFRNRLYQPEMGRFIQPDPKEFEAGDYNLYRYCHNDPVNRTDPTGLIMSGTQGQAAHTHWEYQTDSLIPRIVPNTEGSSEGLTMAQIGAYTEPRQSVCKSRWVEIQKGNRVCYAQWEDCGPFLTLPKRTAETQRRTRSGIKCIACGARLS